MMQRRSDSSRNSSGASQRQDIARAINNAPDTNTNTSEKIPLTSSVVNSQHPAPQVPPSTTNPRKGTDWLGRTQSEPSFQPPLRSDIATIGFPGFLSSYGQLSRYTGPDAVTVLDKLDREKVVAKVTCKFAPRILHNVVPAPDLRENTPGWSFNPVGLATSLKNVGTRWYFRMPQLPMYHSVAALNNMGGYEDQADCVKRIEEGIEYIERLGLNQKIVIFGFSRGGATIMLTALKLRPDLAKKIALVVVEAPFDTFDGVMQDSAWCPSVNKCLFKALCNLSDAEAYAMPEETHLTCPIAFITSDADTRVPKKGTLRAINMIKEKYPHLIVEHLELRHSRHPVMAVSNEVDRDAYILFMEGLYDRYISKQSLSTAQTEDKREAERDAMAPSSPERGLGQLAELV